MGGIYLERGRLTRSSTVPLLEAELDSSDVRQPPPGTTLVAQDLPGATVQGGHCQAIRLSEGLPFSWEKGTAQLDDCRNSRVELDGLWPAKFDRSEAVGPRSRFHVFTIRKLGERLATLPPGHRHTEGP